jgi:propanol-preferring alcohol dehydrogenase
MKAAVLRQFGEPLSLEDVDRPTPASDEVLIQVDACGVCHSDVHVADGDWTQLAKIVKKPLILGHEIAGRVVEMGSGVRDLQLGNLVGVPWIHWSCGECEFCLGNNENLCPKQKITGVTVDGGYAEFVKVPASHALKIPSSLSPIDAAPLFCAGLTVYRALKKAGTLARRRLAVFGIGGLGHLAVQLGKNFGAEVIAIDVSDAKLEFARASGASNVLNTATTDVVKQLRHSGGIHVALVSSGAKAAYDMAFYCLRPTGTLLVVGLPAENICFPPVLMAAAEIKIEASAVGTRRDLQEVLTLAAAGKLHCQTESRPLSEVNQALDDLRRGGVTGRIVLTPQKTETP